MSEGRFYWCDDHPDIWALPKDPWQTHLPANLRERGPRVVAGLSADVVRKVTVENCARLHEFA